MPIGNPSNVEPQRLPFGWIEVIIPIQLDDSFGFHSPRRRDLIRAIHEVSKGQKYTLIDDPNPATLRGGQIGVTVRGPERVTEAYRNQLLTIDTSTFSPDGEPRELPPHRNRQ